MYMYTFLSLRATDKGSHLQHRSPMASGSPRGRAETEWLQRDERFGGLDTLPTLTYTKAQRFYSAAVIYCLYTMYTRWIHAANQPPNKPYDCSAFDVCKTESGPYTRVVMWCDVMQCYGDPWDKVSDADCLDGDGDVITRNWQQHIQHLAGLADHRGTVDNMESKGSVGPLEAQKL